MKRKGIIISLVALVVLAASVGLYFGTLDEKKESGKNFVTVPPMQPVNELPDLVVHMADQSTLNMRDLDGDVLLIFFSPDCDHCQEEAREIAANKAMFTDWRLYFITSYDAKMAEDFAVNYRLNEPNYKFGHSSVTEVFNSVGALTQVPTIIVYKNKKLITKLEGPTPMQTLQEIL